MEPSIMTPWKRLVGLLQLERRAVLQVLYYAIFSGIVTLTLPLGIQAIINIIQGAQMTTSWIVLVFLVTLGVAFAGILQLMQMRIIETIQQRVFTRASFEFTFRFPKIKMDELQNYYPPELANRFFDTLNVQKGLAKILVDIPAAILQIIFALILLSFYHPFFIAFGVLLLILIYTVFRFTAQRGMKTSLNESMHKYKVAHWIQEVARAVTSFKLSGRTKLALTKNDELVTEYLEARESHFKILVIQFIQMISFKVVVTAGLLLIGGLLVLNQEMNIGQFVAAEIIILLVISAVEKLILGLEDFYDILTSLEKIGQVVDKELEAQNGEITDFNKDFGIELDGVSFNVSNRNKAILKNINLKIEAGKSLLIRGESGSGKSSLLRIIAGVIKPTEGSIFIGQSSIDTINLNYYRSQIGLSLSEESPFEGTLRENLTFGDSSITDVAIHETIENTGLLDFVKQLPNGLSTMLYPEGKQMSYSISKKIILSRAILKQPKILILENPLDQFENEEAVRIMNFLTDKSHNWTLIVVSMSKGWEKICDQTITLKQGKIS
ncbi:MAG: ATP-binding cassette domain-containing protein [Bacteroidia bacterium]|nr:ATP-binding cassette domain-containing protein [Bacteroidia bacterium]NND25960.1 ATP-binding cassette domain-containing protein [Flavobacteriaceae bacterium]MBT8277689.1 ATP-binding cassette domain-containing protein [Bacteroidia bacterium]NNK59209.1 ATP-binding cassette domain-containing protein [Flavobacteriaceae bacterium]NNL32345.1 ATP-binding cassette domain-containing protein [Flavobacteriaceae bacterium]